jgi:hypothetical protein
MDKQTSFSSSEIEKITGPLSEANRAFLRRYPGESDRRQAVQTVYGGTHLFKSDTVARLGAAALGSLEQYAPDAATLASALGIARDGKFPQLIYDRVVEKLRREPVEDFRLDFEDGYGNRPDAEEDGHTVAAAAEVARGLENKTLPPFIGIRVKPFNEDLRARSMRTLDLFVTALTKATKGKLPDNFVITVPKIQLPEQVTAAVRLFDLLEKKTGLTNGALRIEPMIETPQAIINQRGEIALQSLVAAAEGRCQSVHFGVYDYTASCGNHRRLPDDGPSGLRFRAADDARFTGRDGCSPFRWRDQHSAGWPASRATRARAFSRASRSKPRSRPRSVAPWFQ